MDHVRSSPKKPISGTRRVIFSTLSAVLLSTGFYEVNRAFNNPGKQIEIAPFIDAKKMPLVDFLKLLTTTQSENPAPPIVFIDSWYDLRRDFDRMVSDVNKTVSWLKQEYPNLDITVTINGAFEIRMENPSILHHRVLPLVKLVPLINSQRPVPKITIQGTDPFGNPSGILHEMEVVKK